MKFLFSALLALSLAFFACSNSVKGEKTALESWFQDEGKIRVLCTTAMIADLVEQVGQERINSITLIRGEVDPHSYELVKGDDEKLTCAQAIFCNGLGLEHGASLRYRLEKHPSVVFLGNEIYKKFPEKMIHVEEQLDPHVWMDISLWEEAVDPIAQSLAKIDPEHADFYFSNGTALKEKMDQVHKEIFTTLQSIPAHKRFLVTSHDAFNYFTRAYLREEDNWKQRCAAPEGLAPDGQLSALDIQRIIDHLFLYNIEVIFPESNVNRDALKKIISSCAEKGRQISFSQQHLYGDAMGPPDSDADTYLKMMTHNARILLSEWGEDRYERD